MRNKKKQTEQLRGKGAAEKETGGTELLLKAISRATISGLNQDQFPPARWNSLELGWALT